MSGNIAIGWKVIARIDGSDSRPSRNTMLLSFPVGSAGHNSWLQTCTNRDEICEALSHEARQRRLADNAYRGGFGALPDAKTGLRGGRRIGRCK